MIPTFVIGLREGLEASLIVGIIAAFLTQRDERGALRPVWIGVGVAVVLVTTVAIVLQVVGQSLPFKQQATMEGTLAIVAVAGVTYMIVWMRRNARTLRAHLEEHVASALLTGSVFALVAMAFLAVLREGLETAIFLLAAFQSSIDPVAAGAGALLGIAVAVGLGYGIYRGGVRINLGRFFRVTGFVLVLVAAGLLATGTRELAEAGLVTALQSPVLDLSWLVAQGSIRASILTGMLGLQTVPRGAEVLVWLVYAVPMSVYVLWPARPGRRSKAPGTTPSRAPAPAGSPR